MKKLSTLALFLLVPTLALAQDYSQAPKVGVPDLTQCLSFGNNGVCNQYRPGGPLSVTSTYSFPAYTGSFNPQNALVPADVLTAYSRTVLTAYNELKFDFIGDSRTSNLYVSVNGGVQSGLSGLNWFNQANALAGNRYQLGINAGQSGCRTDQYLQDTNFNQLFGSDAGWVVFNFPAVNDLAAAGSGCSILPSGAGTFPYINSNGVSVTQSTVGKIAADNIINRVKQIIALGKKVIILDEPGATNLTAASVGQQYDLNARTSAFCLSVAGCYKFSLNSSLWNPTGSTTLDTFLAGSQIDNTTHYSVLGAYLGGVAFNTWFVVAPQIFHKFNAAGSGTSTICRPSFNRIYNYNPIAGLTGQ